VPRETCCFCKKELLDNKRYFTLTLREKGTYGKELSLKFCNFKCLKAVIDDPAIIVTEIL